jgi:hypothetical protein
MPAGDQGIIATRAYDVFSDHTPLVGQYSLLSALNGRLTYSPGPMLYWLIAVPARFGSPHSIALVVGLFNALAVLIAVALARRRGGVALMLTTAVAIALMCRSFMPEALHDDWNPSAGLLPLTALAFACWSLACGEARMLPAVALLASFTAQCQVAFVAPTVAMALVGAAGLALACRRGAARGQVATSGAAPTQERSARPRGAPTQERSPARAWPWALGALAAIAICWAAPAIEQVEHDPGNLALLYRAATTHSHTIGLETGAQALVRAVGVPPRWLRLPGDPFDNRLADALRAPSALAIVSCLALLVALLPLAGLAIRRRRADVASAALIGLLLAACFFAVAASTPVASRKVLGYTLWWGSLAGMWVWLTLGWGWLSLLGGTHHLRRPAPALRRRALPAGEVLRRAGPALARGAVARRAAAVLATAAALGLGLAISIGQPGDAHRAEYGPIASLASQLERSAAPWHGTVWLRTRLGGPAAPLAQAIKFLLRRRGLHVLQQGATARLGPWYELDRRRYDAVVYAYDTRRAPDRRAAPLARARLAVGHGDFETITVSVLRGLAPYTSRAMTRPPRGGRGSSKIQTVR